jgi:hypothetical protein
MEHWCRRQHGAWLCVPYVYGSSLPIASGVAFTTTTTFSTTALTLAAASVATTSLALAAASVATTALTLTAASLATTALTLAAATFASATTITTSLAAATLAAAALSTSVKPWCTVHVGAPVANEPHGDATNV